MKKYIILAAAALATLASCTKIEAEKHQTAISFEALNFKNTKAAINSTTYPENIPFGVFATYLENGKTWAINSADGSSFMNDVECSFDNVGNYAPANTYYWPLEGSVTFQAYSPATASASYTLSTKTLKITDFTLSTTIAEQADLMYSKATDAADKTQNEVVYNSYTTKGVKILFRHALSQLRFYAKTAEDYSATTKYKIDSVIVKDAVNKGTLSVVDDAVSLSSWANGNEKANFVASNTETAINYTSFTQVGDNVLVIPQTVADDLLVKVTYTMYNTEDVKLGSKTVTFKVNTQIAAFNPNTIYNIEMKISAEKILFSPSIVNWDASVVEGVYDLPAAAL